MWGRPSASSSSNGSALETTRRAIRSSALFCSKQRCPPGSTTSSGSSIEGRSELHIRSCGHWDGPAQTLRDHRGHGRGRDRPGRRPVRHLPSLAALCEAVAQPVWAMEGCQRHRPARRDAAVAWPGSCSTISPARSSPPTRTCSKPSERQASDLDLDGMPLLVVAYRAADRATSAAARSAQWAPSCWAEPVGLFRATSCRVSAPTFCSTALSFRATTGAEQEQEGGRRTVMRA
jgi:hypothetical protein